MGFSDNEFLCNSYFMCGLNRVGEAQSRCLVGVICPTIPPLYHSPVG